MSTNENSELCRFCHEKLSLFVSLLQNPHVLNEIESFLLVKIEIDDESPNVVCYRCLFKIESGLEMRELCLKAEHGWRQNIPLAQLNYSLDASSKDFDQYSDSHIHVNVVDPNKDYESDSDDNNRITTKTNNCSSDGKAAEVSKQKQNQQQQQQKKPPPPPQQKQQQQQSQTPPPIQLPPAIRASKTSEMEYRDEITELKEFNITLCKYCDKSFTDNEARIHHENIDHNTKIPYMCNECFIGFRDFVAYSSHLKVVHQNERPFQCVDCQRCFSRRTELRKHSVVHTGLKPFKCTYCEKAFSRNTNLMKHVRLDHSNLRPFGCSQCPKRFNSKSDVSRHVSMTHVNEMRSPPPAPVTNGYHSDAPIVDDFSEVEDNNDDKIMFGGDFGHEICKNLDHDQQQQRHAGEYLPVPEHLLSDFDSAAVSDTNCYYEPDVEMDAGLETDMNANKHHENASNGNSSDTIEINSCANDLGTSNYGFFEERKKRKYVLKNQEMLNRHFCQVCLRRFSSKKALRFHMLRHKGQTALICNICHKKFIRKKDFDRHLVSHTGADPSAALYLNNNHFANNLEQIDTSVVV